MNGGAGAIVILGRKLVSVVGFTVSGDRIVEIDIVANPDRLRGVTVAEA